MKSTDTTSTLVNSTHASTLSIYNLSAELQDRLYRSLNVLIYNLPASNDSTDVDKVKEYFKSISNINFDAISVKRFSKPTLRHNVPPILVRLSSSSEISRILKNKTLLPKDVEISLDRTTLQREQFNRLMATVDIDNKTNPSNLKFVKYIKDIPTIVDDKKSTVTPSLKN